MGRTRSEWKDKTREKKMNIKENKIGRGKKEKMTKGIMDYLLHSREKAVLATIFLKWSQIYQRICFTSITTRPRWRYIFSIGEKKMHAHLSFAHVAYQRSCPTQIRVNNGCKMSLVPFALFLLLLLPPVTHTTCKGVFLSQLRGRETPPENFLIWPQFYPGKVTVSLSSR
jgi:hypothetical protein